jgi:hypothetical protein
LDGGRSWDPVATDVHGTSVAWTPPHAETDSAEVRVEIRDDGGPLGFDSSDGIFSTRFVISGAEADPSAVPTVYALRGNEPNPFNPMTWIRYDLPQPSRVLLRVYDAQGRLVRTLKDLWEPAGRYRVPWDGRDGAGRPVGSGVYFYRIRAERFEASRRMLVLK